MTTTADDTLEQLPQVPIIDLSCPDEEIIPLIANACSDYGFFQIINHGMATTLSSFQSAMQDYFDLPADQKRKRHEQNARGFFDDELTKQKRDWKECLDVGVPGSRDWNRADEDPENACLDGFNVFPPSHPEIRDAIVAYFEDCASVSDRLAWLMARGLNIAHPREFLERLKQHHASYLRLNHYPPCDEEKKETEGILGISPHKDAGFLTILLQDDSCHSLQVWFDNKDWITIHPEPGALTINTGDMCMLWSNGRYKAPLHRVLTNESKKRYSAPFFYNPGYHQMICSAMQDEAPKYHPCLYGYFRAVRFAGDLTNLGVEIQLDDYEVGSNSHHIRKQQVFAELADFSKPFSVDRFRPLLVSEDEE